MGPETPEMQAPAAAAEVDANMFDIEQETEARPQDGEAEGKLAVSVVTEALKTAMREAAKSKTSKSLQLAQFRWQPNEGQDHAVRGFDVRVSWSATQNKNARAEHSIEFYGLDGGLLSTLRWKPQIVADGTGVLVNLYLAQPGKQDQSLKTVVIALASNDAALPCVSDAGIDSLGEAWFSEIHKRKLRFTVSKQDHTEMHSTSWPKYKGPGDWKATQPAIENPNGSEWLQYLAGLCLWTVCTTGMRDSFQEKDQHPAVAFVKTLIAKGVLPPRELYEEIVEVRPMITSPSVDLLLRSEAFRKMQMPWEVIEAACTSLNSGKHIILTGPPGCGKTELARALGVASVEAQMAASEAFLATASPAWTAGDVIGRYFPRNDGKGLRFQPGVFLRAVREKRWLIIDEINRAPIDQCLGELFTVLSGQLVETPYQAGQEGDTGWVRILPSTPTNDSAWVPESADYVVPENWRIIATMNDADRADLHALSFALLRRVDVIRVEAPEPEVRRTLLDGAAVRYRGEGGELNKLGYRFAERVGDELKAIGYKRVEAVFKQALESYIVPLFADVRNKSEAFDFCTERVVGVSTLLETVRFVAEGLRAPRSEGRAATCIVNSDSDLLAATASYAAMAFVLKVMPQLDALRAEPERLQKALAYALRVFLGDKEATPFARIKPEEGGGTHYQVDHVKEIKLHEYVKEELQRHFRGVDLNWDSVSAGLGPA